MARPEDEIAEIIKYGTSINTRFLRQEITIGNIHASLIDLEKSVNKLTVKVEDLERRSRKKDLKNGNRLAL